MRLVDILTPKSDTLQLRLKRKGKPEKGLYTDGTDEVRSKDLQGDESYGTADDQFSSLLR